MFHSSADGNCDRARAPVCVSLEPSVPAASLNNPVLSVHSGVCGSASALSPEAVDTKREERGREANALCSACRHRNQHMISDTLAQDMLPCSYPFIWWFKRLTKTGGGPFASKKKSNLCKPTSNLCILYIHFPSFASKESAQNMPKPSRPPSGYTL